MNLKNVLANKNQHVSFVVPLKHYKNEGKSKEGKDYGEVIIRGFLEGPKAPDGAAVATPAPVAEKEKAASAAPVAEKPAAAAPVATAPAPAAALAPAELTKQPAAPSSARPSAASHVVYDTSKPLRLRIDQLQARDLKDKGGNWDKQDPALRITVGDFKPFDTER